MHFGFLLQSATCSFLVFLANTYSDWVLLWIIYLGNWKPHVWQPLTDTVPDLAPRLLGHSQPACRALLGCHHQLEVPRTCTNLFKKGVCFRLGKIMLVVSAPLHPGLFTVEVTQVDFSTWENGLWIIRHKKPRVPVWVPGLQLLESLMLSADSLCTMSNLHLS